MFIHELLSKVVVATTIILGPYYIHIAEADDPSLDAKVLAEASQFHIPSDRAILNPTAASDLPHLESIVMTLLTLQHFIKKRTYLKRVGGRTMVIHELLLKVVVLGALFGSYHNRLTEAADSMTKPRCRGACGTLSIPYPFGSSDSSSSCRINHPSFIVDCDNSTNPPVPHLNKRSNNIIIFNISVENHEIGVNVSSSQECYNSYVNNGSPSIYSRLSLVDFPISSTKNKFITVGCDTWASLRARDGNYSVVCASFCNYVSDVSNRSCSGFGCCETSIPWGSFGYGISIGSFYEHKYVLDFNPCSYAFVAKNGFYNFSIGNLKQLEFNQSTVVFDWAIGNQTCEDAKKNHKYKCTNNTDAESINGAFLNRLDRQKSKRKAKR